MKLLKVFELEGTHICEYTAYIRKTDPHEVRVVFLLTRKGGDYFCVERVHNPFGISEEIIGGRSEWIDRTDHLNSCGEYTRTRTGGPTDRKFHSQRCDIGIISFDKMTPQEYTKALLRKRD